MAEDFIILQQEQVPPATEIDCIETVKVFDECLLRDCFTAPVLAEVDVDPNCITDITCSDFTITVAAPIIPTRRLTDELGFVRVSFPFTIDYNLNIFSRLTCAPTVVAGTPVTRNVSNVLLYSPESVAYTLTQEGTATPPVNIPSEIIKLEFIGECVDIEFVPNATAPTTTDITPTLGYYLVIKCEQAVQIQVLSRGYCVAPFCESPVFDVCGLFNQRPIPAFFPAQRAPF